MAIQARPRLRSVKSIEPGRFYLSSGDENFIALGMPIAQDGAQRAIFLGPGKSAYKARRVDPERCFEIVDAQLELPELLQMKTGRNELELGAIAIFDGGTRIAVQFGDFDEVGWIDVNSGELNPNESACRHFFVGWRLVAAGVGDSAVPIFLHSRPTHQYERA